MSARPPRVGILAIQGDVDAHAAALARVGAETVRVRRKEDLADLDALVLPGGESTTISKGLERLGLYEPIAAFARAGHPILGTCAGAILLAREVVPDQPSLGFIDTRIERNAFGRQVDSFETELQTSPPLREPIRALFIRAPRFTSPGPVEILARHEGEPVLLRQGRVLAATCHPELTGDTALHALFVQTANAS